MEAYQSSRTPHTARGSIFSRSPVPVAADPPSATDPPVATDPPADTNHSCGHTALATLGDSCSQPLWLVVIINLPVDRLLQVFPFPCWSTGSLFHKLFSAPRVRGSTAQASAAGPALALTAPCAREALLRSEHSWLSTRLSDHCFSGKA